MSTHQPKKYNIQHRKIRKQTMIYEDQQSWISRNQPKDFKSESEFISYLISLGIQAHTKGAAQ